MITSEHQLVISSPDASEQHWDETGAQPGIVARTIYRTSYVFSFSVMFPTLVVASMLPRRNAAACGVIDGARAAHEAQQRVRDKAAFAASATKTKVGDVYAGVAARVSQRVEAIEDAIAERRYRRRIVTI